MTSPMFTRGFSFGMVSPHEGVAYSLTAGVARGIFRQVVPIRQRLRGGRDGTAASDEGKRKEASRSPPFSEHSPGLQYATTGVTIGFVLGLPLPAAGGGIPAAFRWVPSPAGLWSTLARPRRPLSPRLRRSPRPCRRRQSRR